MNNHERLRAVALGNQPGDLLLRGGHIVDVLTETVYDGEVLIADGIIAAVAPWGTYPGAKEVIDLHGAYVSPGLINSHCHVESSMARPENYCAAELRWGVTTLITDPHEIANVAGAAGIKYMLQAGRKMPINYYVEVPSCVPATPFEHSGCIMKAADLEPLLKEEGVLGLGEVMNVPGVLGSDPDVIAKLQLFRNADRPIDGHAPVVSGKALQAYVGSGIDTDHESISWMEAREKLRAGLAVLVREGSASRNLTNILKGALEEGVDVSNMAFCTDDKHLADIVREGTIRHCVEMAIALGIPAVRALRMASINAAKIYGLKRLGALAPGWQADIVVFDNLETLRPVMVLHQGEDAWKTATAVIEHLPAQLDSDLCTSVRIADASYDKLRNVHFENDKTYTVIDMIPGEIFTEKTQVQGSEIPAKLASGELHMIAVLERHHATGLVGIGLIRGYGLKDGAAATTVGHDSHNLIVVGSDVDSMLEAVRELVRVQGGYTLIRNHRVAGTVKLDIGGLMSSAPTDQLTTNLERISMQAHDQGVTWGIDPFISLSFMALPVIPRVRITDMGLFDVDKFTFIS